MYVGIEIAALKRMTVTELRKKHAEVFGEPTRSGHKDYLVKRIVWRIQANAEGDISQRARRRAEELANDADLRTHAPRTKPDNGRPGITTRATVAFDHDPRVPMPGSILTRRYKNRDIIVRVLPKGFEFEGEIYRSLSGVAKAVSGKHWNGYHFFNLNQNGMRPSFMHHPASRFHRKTESPVPCAKFRHRTGNQNGWRACGRKGIRCSEGRTG